MGKLFQWFKNSQAPRRRKPRRETFERSLARRGITTAEHMTPYQQGYADGYKGRASRYAPDALIDPYHDPVEVRRQLAAPSTPAEYRLGYRVGDADSIADRPYDETRRR